MQFFLVSDLHGKIDRYNKLFNEILEVKPEVVFMGGDLLPSGLQSMASTNAYQNDFINDVLIKRFSELRTILKGNYPQVYIIFGNDDSKVEEEEILKGEALNLWKYIHKKKTTYGDYTIYGYSNIPPSPFILKDFERYDVSEYVDPGCIPPEDGVFTHSINKKLLKRETIKNDLEQLIGDHDLSKTIVLFHSPPYQSKLDRAALDGKKYNHVPLDLNIGSIAIKRFIHKRQPKITLHGHVHESTRLSGSWADKLDRTYAFSAAHDGEELAIVIFDPEQPDKAHRKLL